jgi:hypothetical protein
MELKKLIQKAQNAHELNELSYLADHQNNHHTNRKFDEAHPCVVCSKDELFMNCKSNYSYNEFISSIV